MAKTMGIVSKFSLAAGILSLIPSMIMFFVLQVYFVIPYWLVIIFCLTLLVQLYKDNNFAFMKRVTLYILVLCNVFAVYGFGIYCDGDYNFDLVSHFFCINLGILVNEPNNPILLLINTMAVVGLCLIEVSYRLRIKLFNSSKNQNS